MPEDQPRRLALVRTRITSASEQSREETPPEALFISSLIDEGIYRPSKHGIKTEMLSSYKQVHEFCLNYQAKAHEAPPIALVLEKYPSFPYFTDLSPKWAAADLVKAWRSRRVRRTIGNAIALLDEDDIDGAVEELSEGIRTSMPVMAMGVDMSEYEDAEEVAGARACIDYNNGMLQRVTGGIGVGEVLVFSARIGEGKSYDLQKAAVSIAESGWNVAFLSLEMKAPAVRTRLRRLACRDLLGEPWEITHPQARAEALREWQAGSGRIRVYDESDIGIVDATTVASAAADNTVVIVDYIGLMATMDGKAATDDHAHTRAISRDLHQVAIMHNIPILTAQQINRSGASAADEDLGLEHLSGSDGVGQDADMVVMSRLITPRVKLNVAAKIREGQSGQRWYTRFDPAEVIFEDLNQNQANALMQQDRAAQPK